MKTTLLLLTCSMFVLITADAAPYGDGFASGKASDYAEGSGKIEIDQQAGQNALVITDTQAIFKPVLVTGGEAFRLSFNALFSGDVESIEENPRFAIFTQPSERSPILPSREIEFLDQDEKFISRTCVSSMPFRRDHKYSDEFYAPDGAVALRLKVSSGNGVALTIWNLKLEPFLRDSGVLNLNPAFELGLYNYSGWQSISAGGKLIEINGQPVFDSKYGSRGTTFPLAGPGTYALSAKATGNGYNATVHLDIFDSEGKKLIRSTVRRFGEANYFVVPSGASSASLLVYSCLLEEVQVRRVGDEDAIAIFLDQ